MPKKYGLPYMGSKDKIADRILRHLPSADCFVDLCAGGCSMTHAALLSGRYKRVIANDVSDIPQVFVNAAKGIYDNEDRWISREDFYRLKDDEPYIRLVWSFSNNLNDYIYGRDIEPFKKALHWAVYYRDPEPLKAYGIDVSEAMEVDDRYQRWLAVKRICENGGGGSARLQSAERANLLAELSAGKTAHPHRDSDGGVRFDSYQRANHISNLGGGYRKSRLTELHHSGMLLEHTCRTSQRRNASRKLPAATGFRIACRSKASNAAGLIQAR